jgi:hypothetical protein
MKEYDINGNMIHSRDSDGYAKNFTYPLPTPTED